MSARMIERMTTPQPIPLEPVDVDEPQADDAKFFSVTTILKAVPSPGLEYWAIKQAANAALDSPGTVKSMLDEQGRDETVKWLCAARHRNPRFELSAADLGTVVHKLCENYAITGQRPTQEFIENEIATHAAKTVSISSEMTIVNQMLNQFDNWLQRFTPEYTAAEMAVYSDTYGYAGTLDAILTLDGVRFLSDYKTRREPLDGKGKPQQPYPETCLQLSAYRYADLAPIVRARRYEKNRRRYYLLNNEERDFKSVKIPEVDSGLCILITPASCEAHPMKCDEPVFDHFLHVMETFRWMEQESKRVVAGPLVAATPVEVAPDSELAETLF